MLKLSLLAVALAQGGRLFILDEPTSMVDIVTKMHVWDTLSVLSKEQSILIASHDMNEVKRLCNRVYVLVDGKIVAEGSPEEISQMLKLPCTMKLMVSDVEGVKSFLEERQGQFVMENSVLDISVDSLDAAIELITEINHAFFCYLHRAGSAVF